MTKKISTMPPRERLDAVMNIVANDGELNATDGMNWAVSVPAVLTYEAVRGVSEPTTMRCRVIGLSYDVAKYQHGLVVVEDGQLRTVPLTTLVSIGRQP